MYQNMRLFEIRGFHGGEDNDGVLLGFGAVFTPFTSRNGAKKQ
jgi:hypothetical protein